MKKKKRKTGQYEVESIDVYPLFSSDQWPPREIEKPYVCFYDGHPFDHAPVGIVLKKDKEGRWYQMFFGTFCSLNCIRSFIDNDVGADVLPVAAVNLNNVWTTTALFYQTFSEPRLTNVFETKRSPPTSRLRAWGGPLTIEEFRQRAEISHFKLREGTYSLKTMVPYKTVKKECFKPYPFNPTKIKSD